jgi:hypothetical protein
MTAPPSWSSGDPELTARLGMPAQEGERVAFRNLLGVAQFAPAAPSGPPGAGMHVSPSAISQRFEVGPAQVIVEAAGGNVDQVAETARKRLHRRAYNVGATYPTQVAGYPGLGRVVQAKKKGQRPAGPPVVQSYAIVGPYALILSVNQADAAFATSLGQVALYPAAPPVISPIVRIPGADRYDVRERVIITRDWVKLTGHMSKGHIIQSSEQFAMEKLAELRGLMVNMAVDNWQPDVFLGGQPCVRDTFLHGGTSRSNSMVRSEFWWAGVVGGRGIQLFVTATKSIISLDEARPLRDVIVLLPPD